MENGREPRLSPAQLPPGTVVGPWRVVDWRAQGTYGVVYRAFRVGQSNASPVALKLALYPFDPRFTREAELLSRLLHPSVPRLLDFGYWRPASGIAHPCLVMEWMEGTPLYEWAREHPPSSPQVLLLLAQLARALQAVHAAGAVHRDVKGDNILVRRSDSRAVLTDFGSGSYQGAARLTWQCLPPGTPAYRSPEAWRFALRFGPTSSAHYVSGPADDLFALGVTAYRLVTGQYPPTTEPEVEEARIWLPEGPGPRPPRALNPEVAPELSTLILRMLSVSPEARGTAEELAEALEVAAERAGSEAQRGHSKRKTPPPATSPSRRFWPRAQARDWLPWLAALTVALPVLLWGWQAVSAQVERLSSSEQVAQGESARDAGSVAVGETSLTAPLASIQPPVGLEAIALDMPPKPLPGQLRPDANGQCPRRGQVAINGGCWLEFAMDAEGCKANGENTYSHKDKCYAPALAPRRQPTSSPTDTR